MTEYMIRRPHKTDLLQIVKKSGDDKYSYDSYSYWNNYLRDWKPKSETAMDVFTGWSDELYFPITEEEVNEIIAKYPKES